MALRLMPRTRSMDRGGEDDDGDDDDEDEDDEDADDEDADDTGTEPISKSEEEDEEKMPIKKLGC